jgi:dihydrofolate synthase/folylpolyglutamate synthase
VASTPLAFFYCAEWGVHAGVTETGLGGRLDSTNVIVPSVAVVTSIGIDHVEYLGSTREAIAVEKAGIFKAGAAAAIGDSDPAIASLLGDRARAAGSEPVETLLDRGWPRDIVVSDAGTSFTLPDAAGTTRRWRTPLVGRHQAANTALALLAHDLLGADLRLEPEARQAALDGVRLPGRFQRLGDFILDVAHNPDGSAVLAATLARVQPPRPLVTVLAVLADKDWRGMMAQLAPHTDLFVLTTAPTAPANRLWDPRAAHAVAAAAGWASVVEPELGAALALARREGATVLVTGSFHTVGDALARLPATSRAG